MARRKREIATALMTGAAVAVILGATAHAADNPMTQTGDAYFLQAQETLQRTLAQQPNTNRAKNVILFVGDGMGISSVTASRIFAGQQAGQDGESHVLAFEAFPYAALSKTYSSDGQVSDSAPTATAMVTGIKLKNDMLGVNDKVMLNDCAGALANKVTTLVEMAELAGMSTGAISTARLTHATPAATYAHSPNRDWEADGLVPPEAAAAGCTDIARQLVEMSHGDGLEIAMGGGREMFLPETMDDPEDAGKKGKRKDGKDLTKAWTDRYGNSGAYVWNTEQFAALDPANVDHVLGLFERSHMEYEFDREKDAGREPSLAEMTVKAIDVLAKNPQGFFLMVEGGRIDHAHHAGNAFRALTDAVAFDEAIKAAVNKLGTDDTLMIVTADHSHAFTISGYPKRGNPILGVAVDVDGKVMKGLDEKPYTTLSYANGPGAPKEPTARPDVMMEQATDPDYIQQALVPLTSETHTGEDVGIYAIGPWAHLFQNTVEQNYIFHVIDHATKLSERAVASANGQPVKKADAN